jgi:hypothetical protein
MTDKNLESKLRKLLILSERGIDGEKENAAEMLDKLLERHGLKLSDISDEAKEGYWFKYKGKMQERLLQQVIIATAGKGTKMWSSRSKRSKVGADLTKCQMLEIEMLFSAYKVALDEELDFALEAFVNKNHIFPQSDSKEVEREYTAEEIQRSKLMAERMMSMKKIEVRKQLHGNT